MNLWGLIVDLFKGKLPDSIKLILVGVVLASAFVIVRDWKREFETNVKNEATAVRTTLTAYIAANEAWQQASKEERKKLLIKADRRIGRLYAVQGWDYEPLFEEVK